MTLNSPNDRASSAHWVGNLYSYYALPKKVLLIIVHAHRHTPWPTPHRVGRGARATIRACGLPRHFAYSGRWYSAYSESGNALTLHASSGYGLRFGLMRRPSYGRRASCNPKWYGVGGVS